MPRQLGINQFLVLLAFGADITPSLIARNAAAAAVACCPKFTHFVPIAATVSGEPPTWNVVCSNDENGARYGTGTTNSLTQKLQ